MSKSRTPVPITTDEDALLAGVWAAPHDDLPRLVYADYLDENGLPEQAEFIRVQCALAALDAEWADPPPGLREREAELLAENWAAWRSGLPAALRDTPHRGFPRPRYSTVKATEFAGLADDPAAPLWDYVLTWTKSDDLACALAGPLAPRVGWLDLQAQYGWEAADVDALLAGQDRLGNVSQLRLVGTMPPADIARLFAGLRLPHLDTLEPTQASMGVATAAADTFRALDAAGLAPQLRRLDLRGVFSNGASVAVLGRCRNFPRLRSLRFGRTSASDRNLAALVASPLLAPVRDLDFGESKAGDATAAAVASDPASARLRRLGFTAKRLTAAGFAALAASDHLDNLRELWLLPRHETPVVPSAVRERFRGRIRPAR